MQPLSFAGSGVQKAWAQKTLPRHLRFVSTLTPFFGDNCFAFLKVQFQTCYWVLLKTEHLGTGHRASHAMWSAQHRSHDGRPASLSFVRSSSTYEITYEQILKAQASYWESSHIFTSWTLVRFSLSQLTPMTSRGICSNQLTENKSVRFCLQIVLHGWLYPKWIAGALQLHPWVTLADNCEETSSQWAGLQTVQIFVHFHVRKGGQRFRSLLTYGQWLKFCLHGQDFGNSMNGK